MFIAPDYLLETLASQSVIKSRFEELFNFEGTRLAKNIRLLQSRANFKDHISNAQPQNRI